MDHLWGISGTMFLLFYGVVLVASTVFAVVVRRRVLAPPTYQPVTDLPEVAYLVAGRHRLVELSVARLISAGAARVNREGMITGLAVKPDDPLDAAVLLAMGTRPRHRHDQVHAIAMNTGVRTGHVERVERSLVAGGQLITAAVVRKTRRMMTSGLWLLVVVGLVRWFHGLAADRPVGFLTVELVATAVAIQVLRVRPLPTRTEHGDRTVEEARKGATGMARVALHGLSEYPDKEIQQALRAPSPESKRLAERRRSAGTTSGSTLLAGGLAAGYSGSSCGGGDSSCGSSGCGGCG